jgi:hypothetical protein
MQVYRRSAGKSGQKERAVKYAKGVVAGALVTLVGACGSNAPTASNTPTSIAAPTTHAPTPATTPAPNLTAELLAVSDFPSGWSVVGNSDSGEPKCIDTVRSALNATSKAEVTFAYGSNGAATVEESLAYVPGRGHSAMTAMSRILSGCGPIHMTTNGQTLTGTVGSMSFPAVADQSFAYQMNLTDTVSGQSITVPIGIVVFRKADTVAMILYANPGNAASQPLETVVQDAAAKVS